MCNAHLLIVVAFTALQLAVLAIFGYTPYPDSEGYIKLASECVSLNDLYPAASTLNDLAFIWNVGSINAVAASLRLFGSITPLLILYSLMKGTTAWLTYKTTAKAFDGKTAMIALCLYAAYPANYGEGTSLLSETPFMFLTMLGMYAAVCRDKSFASGTLMALANWFRPMGLVFLLALLTYKRKHAIRQMAGYAAAICLIGSTCYLRTGHFIYQAKTGWMALLQYSVDNTADPTDDTLVYTGDANAVEKDAIWRNNFKQWLLSHPTDYVRQMPKKLAKTYISDNVNMCVFLKDKGKRKYMYEEISMRSLAHDFPRYSAAQLITLTNLLYYYALMVMFVLGTAKMLAHKEYDKATLPLATTLTGTAVLLLFGHGEARFHTPFMPFVIMAAAHWVAIWLKQRKYQGKANQA